MKKVFLFSISVLFFIGQNFVPNSFSAQVDYFLKLDGIQGSDTVRGEAGWIRLYTVQYNETPFEFTSSMTDLTNQLGQVDTPKWTLSKQVDKSSPLLFEAVATGKHIKEGILSMCNDDQCESKIFLTDVSVVGFNMNSTAGTGIETIILQSSSVKGETGTVIPSWIKNNARWFAEGSIGQSDFTKGIEYMIKEGIMKIPDLPPSASGVAEAKVPDWIKNNARWWADGLITDQDFVKGIQYLVEKGIIKV
ncbi:MAG TPA: type VI secretion system tube protein Hcp [Nitrosopumilaceae archaeon]|nr:type VI secretion system tube protein Hcp [Nitrosopumilaceae archaeon]